MKIVGIAGGSGAGKTTLAANLVTKYPDKIEVINQDKYKKIVDGKANLPVTNGLIDWDHPDGINWEKLINDVKLLQKGKSVTIEIWSLLKDPQNPKFKEVRHRTLQPKEILIVEGFLALWSKDLRSMYDKSYFIDLDEKIRLERRIHHSDPLYDRKIQIPTHYEHIEPTKKFADLIFDAAKLNQSEVLSKVEKDLKQSKILK